MTGQFTKKSQQRLLPQFVVMLLLILAITTGFGCGNPKIDLTGYGSDTITLIGIQDSTSGNKSVVLTIAEIQGFDCVTLKTNSTSDKIGEVKATGPLLETIVANYGAKLDDFKKIIITATDGYEIVLTQPFISENQLILAFGIDGKPLGEDEAPLRLIVPDSDSAYWIRMVKSIEFIL